MTCLDEWTYYLTATGAAPATIHVRTSAIRTLMRTANTTDPANITRRDVIAFLARDTSRWTRTVYWQSVRSWCAWLNDFGYIDGDLLRGIPRPRPPAPVARPLSQESVRKLLAWPAPDRTRAFILLALYCGLRVHEVAKLKGEHFDLSAGWMLVAGKGGDTEPVPLHAAVVELALRMPRRGYWFPSRVNPHVSSQVVSAEIRKAMRACGVSGTPHMLRDTIATKLQRENCDIRMTQAFMRHRHLDSTMKYTKVSDSALAAAVQGLTWGTAA